MMLKMRVIIVVGLLASGAVAQQRQVPEGVWVRDGYELTVAADVINARFMCVSPDGTLYVSQPARKAITSLRDADGDGFYEWSREYVTAKPAAHGLFWHEGELWFSMEGAVVRSKDNNGDGVADSVTTVVDNLPTGGHWWRSIMIHNRRLYTSIGDSGNITDEADTKPDRQKIWSYALDGSDKQMFVSGIRNTEKLVVRPGTEEIWGIDHGSDWFGRQVGDTQGKQPVTDYNPPDEMNHYVAGGFYGHPFIVGLKLPRYEYMHRPDINELANRTIVPEWCLEAHSACNAMMFYSGEQFAAEHRGDAFVAQHGSWNRLMKSGYKLVRVMFENGHPYGSLVYVNFLTEDQQVLGRPVDVVSAADGTLLISDDHGNRVYRLRWVGE